MHLHDTLSVLRVQLYPAKEWKIGTPLACLHLARSIRWKIYSRCFYGTKRAIFRKPFAHLDLAGPDVLLAPCATLSRTSSVLALRPCRATSPGYLLLLLISPQCKYKQSLTPSSTRNKRLFANSATSNRESNKDARFTRTTRQNLQTHTNNKNRDQLYET